MSPSPGTPSQPLQSCVSHIPFHVKEWVHKTGAAPQAKKKKNPAGAEIERKLCVYSAEL